MNTEAIADLSDNCLILIVYSSARKIRDCRGAFLHPTGMNRGHNGILSIEPALKLYSGLLAHPDSGTTTEPLTTGDVNVTTKVGRKVRMSVTDDSNHFRTKCSIEESELEKHVEVRDALLATTELCTGFRREDNNGPVYLIANSSKLLQKRLAGRDLVPPREKGNAITATAFDERLSLRYGGGG